jgi:homoserine dehydrogenase
LQAVSIGICGLGTVGRSVFEVLQRNRAEITRRAGCDLRVSVVGMRRDQEGFDPGDARVERDVMAVAAADDVDVIIELIGGITDARELVL